MAHEERDPNAGVPVARRSVEKNAPSIWARRFRVLNMALNYAVNAHARSIASNPELVQALAQEFKKDCLQKAEDKESGKLTPDNGYTGDVLAET